MIAKHLDKLTINNIKEIESVNIDNQNWKDFYNDNSKATFRIAYNGTKVALFYEVWEDELIANTTENNTEVYKDSCVEFFIKGDESYYINFEFSLSCCALVQKGVNRKKREFFENDKINTIQREISRSKKYWNLFTIIDLEEFGLIPKEKYIQEISWKFNAYCCNESSVKPHFLTLFAIKSRHPDFHLPSYFSTLEFEIPRRNH